MSAVTSAATYTTLCSHDIVLFCFLETMAVILPLALGILLMTGVGKALIPKPCANAGNFTNRECCPSPERLGPNAGACGTNLNRGTCIQIPNSEDLVNRSDARQYWPRFFFTRVCRCSSNYGGYDCGECAFGYRGPNCDQRYSRQRRSTSELTNNEWTTYINQLQMAKSSTESRYQVITSPPDYNNPAAIQTVDIGVYNLFVWFHHYVAKNNDGMPIYYITHAINLIATNTSVRKIPQNTSNIYC